MKAGGWPSILVAYILGVLSVASLVVMVPLQGDFIHQLGMSVGQYGLLIGLIGIPAAALATVSGGLVDRFGPRTMMIAGALIAAILNLGYGFISDVDLFLPLRLIEGFSFSIALAAGPAFIIRTTQGKRQVAAMTFWSTATPMAISLGMVLGGFFAGGPDWRDAFLVYAAALIIAAGAGLLLPRLPRERRSGSGFVAGIRMLIAGYRRGGAVKLGSQLFLVAASSLGLNAILPTYLASTHTVSLAAASGLIAGANLAMILGALLLGVLMTRGIAPRHLLAGFTAGAVVFAAAVLWPGTPIGGVGIMFAGWSLIVGASQALVFVVLPRIADPAAPGLATGVINQLSSLSSFIAPMLFLVLLPYGWPFIVAVIGLFWVLALSLFRALPLEQTA